jgi:5-methylthioadenosine/S-adenosylhomocysteine deaminase
MDTIISASWIIPVVPEGKILKDHSILIKSGKIHDLVPSSELSGRYSSQHHIELADHALVPGFVNSHCHTPMNLLRGLADDLPLMTWLEKHIWPMEGEFADGKFCADGTELAIAELLRSGSTCVADMYFFPEASAEIFDAAGFRASVGLTVIEFPTKWAKTTDEYFEKCLKVNNDYKYHPLISCMFAPHAPYTVSDDSMSRIRTLCNELEIPIQMHIHETSHESVDSIKQYGMRPIERLDKLGLLGPDLMAVHMTDLTEEEIDLLVKTGTHVVHCPESNMKLASGICPVPTLLEAGVNVALGTDGTASNNDLDMIGEMKSAAFLSKIGAGDAVAVTAEKALSMATINGARALGLGDKVGSLERGKQADITAIDLGQLEQQPMYNPISQIVYSVDKRCVTDVWVAGRHLMKGRELTTLDQDKIMYQTKQWQDLISKAD